MAEFRAQIPQVGGMFMKQLVIDLPESEAQKGSALDYPNCYAAIPTNGKVCEHTGLKHAHLYSLLTGSGAARPFVRVANLKLPGASKGKTLFHVGDMLRFLDRIAAQQETGLKRFSEK